MVSKHRACRSCSRRHSLGSRIFSAHFRAEACKWHLSGLVPRLRSVHQPLGLCRLWAGSSAPSMSLHCLPLSECSFFQVQTSSFFFFSVGFLKNKIKLKKLTDRLSTHSLKHLSGFGARLPVSFHAIWHCLLGLRCKCLCACCAGPQEHGPLRHLLFLPGISGTLLCGADKNKWFCF